MKKTVLGALTAVLLSLVAFTAIALAQAVTYSPEFTTAGSEFEQALARALATDEGERLETYLQGNGIPITIKVVPAADMHKPNWWGQARATYGDTGTLECAIYIRETNTGGVVNLAETIYHEMRHCEIFKTYDGTNTAAVETANCGLDPKTGEVITDAPYLVFRGENVTPTPSPTPSPAPTPPTPAPTPTPTPSPFCPTDAFWIGPVVGGTTELFVSGSDAPSENGGSSGDSTLPIAATAGMLIALAGGGLYMRRRLVR